MSNLNIYRVLASIYLLTFFYLIGYSVLVLKNKNYKLYFLNTLNFVAIILFIIGFRIYTVESVYIKYYLYELYFLLEQFLVSILYMLILKICKPYLKIDWKYRVYVFIYPILTTLGVGIILLNKYVFKLPLFNNGNFLISLFYTDTLMYSSTFYIVAIVLIIVKLLLDKISVSTTYKGYYVSFLTLSLGIIVYKAYSISKLLSDVDLAFFVVTIIILTNIVVLKYINEAKLVLSRERVFNKLSTAYVIVDSNGTIVDYNTSFEVSFLEVVDNKYRKNLNNLLGEFKFEKSFENSKEYKNDIILKKEAKNTSSYYIMISTRLGEAEGDIVGKLVEFIDITDRIELIRKQNDLLNLDELTGLYSRRYYYNIIEEYNEDEYLPIGFFSFDINNLKIINDTYGHEYGDKYLKINSRTIKEEILPEEAISARVGGDEIISIILNCNDDIISKIEENLNKKNSESTIKPYDKINVSMGYELKRSVLEESSDILAIADKKMYKHKEELKRGKS